MSMSPEAGRFRNIPVSIVPLTRPAVVSAPPIALTPIVGREHELAAACDLIRHRGARLVTLTGPGGVGKTRLALQIAAELREDFAGAVAWVPLATVTDAGAVVPTIARSLGLGETGNVPPLDTLRAALRDARLLLVLDNFEQVLPAGTEIVELVASCPGPVVLVTSRSLLRVSGEHAVEVPPLPLPEAWQMASAEQVAQADAVKLFVARAQAISPAFVLNDENAPLVGEICRRLEGLPLAIELAAARVNLLSLPALRSRLEHRLLMLTGGARDQPARLRAMRDAIAWSYDLLSPEEQAVFRRLAIFNGGCRLDIAVDVCRTVRPAPTPGEPSETGATPVPAHDLLDVVAALVDHSLLREVNDPDGEPRYLMLETVREYGLECLERSGETEAVQRARAESLLAHAQRLELASLLPDEDRSLALIETMHANLLEALTWLDATDDTERLLQLAGALAYSWFAAGRYRDGRNWLERALSRCSDGSAADRARALVGLALLIAFQSGGTEAEHLFEEGLALWRAVGDSLHASIALIGLGALANLQGNYERAKGFLNEALGLAQTLDNPALAAFVAASAHANLGGAAHGQGELALAATHHEQALALRRRWGHMQGVSRSLGDLAEVARDQHDIPRALDFYRQSLALPLKQPDRRALADIFTGAAHIAIAQGQPERAIHLLGAAEVLREAMGTTIRLPVDRAAYERTMAAAHVALGEGAFATAWAVGRALSVDQAAAEVAELAARTDAAPPVSAMAARYMLTPREVDVLRGLTEHLTDREIAERLFLSHRTVGWHVTSILAKLNVTSRRAAAAKATREGLV